MKIAHVNTFPRGGAATAALRLHNALLEKNIESSFICLNEPAASNIRNCVAVEYAQPSLWSKITNKLGWPITAAHKREQLSKKYHPQSEFLGLPFSDYRLEDITVLQEADIINLHWVQGFLNYPSFFKRLSKPIVWTIHDLSPFMGCFNYPMDQINNPRMAMIDQEFYDQKISALKGYNYPIHIAAPSVWIKEAAQAYKPFTALSFHHIPYGIDNKEFRHIDAGVARDSLGLPKDKFIVLFVSESVENKRKRFDRILALAEQLTGNDVLFVAIGKEPKEINNNTIKFVGNVSSTEQLNLYYAAANFFLMPSQEDNFPNVVLESLFCGTPVISNNAGGMKDIINDSNGFLVDDFNISEICTILKDAISNARVFDNLAISNTTRTKYSSVTMADSYIKLYNELKE
jgi:glycosyltransferase involved in cell wall biosynthesis